MISRAHPLQGRRVLIVEDRYLIAQEMADIVYGLGASVVGPLRELAAATDAAEQEAIDLAILDVNLDGETVYPLAEALQARGVPFLFLTGYDEDILPPAWRGRPRLVKPVHPRLLRDELVRLTGAPA